MRMLHIQKDLFWEDENATSNWEVAAKYFVVNEIRDNFREAYSGIFRASLDYARLAKRDFSYANALNWLPALREDCLSRQGYFTDAAHALSELRNDNHRFIRPVEPYKLFAGQMFDEESFKTELRFLEQNRNTKPNEVICLVSTENTPIEEWRCIFVNQRYVAGSQYMHYGRPTIKRHVPEEVIVFSERIAAHPMFVNKFDFVIDVARSGAGFKVVEVNAFETASFYAADLDAIYSAWAKSFEIDIDDD